MELNLSSYLDASWLFLFNSTEKILGKNPELSFRSFFWTDLRRHEKERFVISSHTGFFRGFVTNFFSGFSASLSLLAPMFPEKERKFRLSTVAIFDRFARILNSR